MQFVQIESQPPLVRSYSKNEVDGLIVNVLSMNLPQGDPYLKLLEGTTFIGLDKLFNGPKN